MLAFLVPSLIGLTLGTFGSIFATIGISFTDWDLLTPAIRASVRNDSDLPRVRLFKKSLINTLAFSAIYVPLTVILSLAVAMGLNYHVPGIGLFRTAFFLPTVSSATAVGLLWAWIYAEDRGALNAFVTALGGDPVAWLGPKVALYSTVIVTVCGAIGGGKIIFLAGLQAIPKDYDEVAKLDGATPWQRLRFVTIPALAPTIFFQTALTTINAV